MTDRISMASVFQEGLSLSGNLLWILNFLFAFGILNDLQESLQSNNLCACAFAPVQLSFYVFMILSFLFCENKDDDIIETLMSKDTCNFWRIFSLLIVQHVHEEQTTWYACPVDSHESCNVLMPSVTVVLYWRRANRVSQCQCSGSGQLKLRGLYAAEMWNLCEAKLNF